MNKFNNFLNNSNAEEALKDVIKSGLEPDILNLANVKVFNGSKEELEAKLGFSININDRDFIEFPYFSEDGSILFYRYKILPPINKDGNEIKYLQPKNTPAIPYILPFIWNVKDKPNKPIWITEGEKKALKLIQHNRYAIALSGVWNFKAGKDSESLEEDKKLFSELREFNWNGRNVYLAFDMDLWINPLVRQALYELSLNLISLKAIVKFVSWDKSNKGIDDYLVNFSKQEKDLETELTNLEDSAKDLRHFAQPEHWDEIKKALLKVNITQLKAKELVNAIAQKKSILAKDLWQDFYQTQKDMRIRNTEIITGDELMKKEFKDTEWIIEDIIPKGLSILAGKPKIGKSWFALQEALEYAKNEPTLYIALEDKPQRLQKRMIDLNITEPPKNFNAMFEILPINSDGIKQLKSLIERTKAKLVIIDTFQRFRGTDKKGNNNIYSMDYEIMEKIKKIADEFDIGILLLHHTRKGESNDPVELISGTTGLAGGADTLLVLQRGRGKDEATLFITGRDIEEKNFALKFIDNRWEFLGDSDEYKKSQVRMKIIEILKEAEEPLSSKAIVELTDLKAGTVTSALYRMVKDGEILKPEKNKYVLPENFIPEEIFETELKNSKEENKNQKGVRALEPSSVKVEMDEENNNNINNYEVMNLFNSLTASGLITSTLTSFKKPMKFEVKNEVEKENSKLQNFTAKINEVNNEGVSSDEGKKVNNFTTSQLFNNFFQPSLQTQIQSFKKDCIPLLNNIFDSKIEKVEPCKNCGNKIFWRNKVTNDINCARCYPSPDKSMVESWIGNWLEDDNAVEIAENNNQLVTIKSKTAGLTFKKEKWNLKEDLEIEQDKIYTIPSTLANYLVDNKWAEILESINE